MAAALILGSHSCSLVEQPRPLRTDASVLTDSLRSSPARARIQEARARDDPVGSGALRAIWYFSAACSLDPCCSSQPKHTAGASFALIV
jgi:hypothetical protein